MSTEEIILGIIIGIVLGIPLGWMISQFIDMKKSNLGVIIERDEKGKVVAILPAPTPIK